MTAKEFIVFRAGDYPQGKYTEKDLDEMVETFNANEPPHIIIGHSSDYKGKTRIPSFGQILGGLKRVGKDLIAIGAEFNEKLAKWIQEGFYNQRSIELAEVGGKKKIVALGMLGACPPAVKGLPAMDEALDEIAMQFSAEMPVIEFSDKVEFDAVEETEKLGKEHTKKDIDECLAELSESLSEMIDKEETGDRIRAEIYEHLDDLFKVLDMHSGFIKKLEAMEEKTEGEMAEKKSWFKTFAEFMFNKHKETEMDKKERDELTAKIAALEAQNKEFADKESLAKEQAEQARLKAEQDAADAKLRTDIREFLDKNGKNLKIVDELNIPELMFQLAKTQGTVEFKDGEKVEQKPLLTVFQDLLAKLPTVQLGETKEMREEKPVTDIRPRLIQDAERYVNEHPKEFSGMTKEQAISKALVRRSYGEIKFS